MTWDNTNKEYIATSQTEREARLIDLWNTYTGADITLDNYSGSGLQGAFFTFIQALGSLENDVVALQSNISNALKDLNQKVLRPPVVLDRCRDLIKQLELDVAIFDNNFIKLSSEPRGYYLVSKGAIPNDKTDALDELFKKTVVAGIKTFGTTALNTILEFIKPLTTACGYAEVFYSLDGGTTFIEGYYSIPYDKYISVAISDIIIEEL